MGVVELVTGDFQPVCSDCGIALCFEVEAREYERTMDFWDAWRCCHCDPHAIGSFARWLESKRLDDSVNNLVDSEIGSK